MRTIWLSSEMHVSVIVWGGNMYPMGAQHASSALDTKLGCMTAPEREGSDAMSFSM